MTNSRHDLKCTAFKEIEEKRKKEREEQITLKGRKCIVAVEAGSDIKTAAKSSRTPMEATAGDSQDGAPLTRSSLSFPLHSRIYF